MGKKEFENALEKTAEFYTDSTELRAAVQLIPYVGGPLDTLLSGKGQSIQYQRIMMFIEELQKRMDKVESLMPIDESDEFYDLMMSTFTAVAKTRSVEKRKAFASILVNKLVQEYAWDEAETMVRLLDSLNDVHIHILKVVLSIPLGTANDFEGKRIVLLRESSSEKPNYIFALMPGISHSIIRMACSELVSKGLLYDEGIGRISARGMEMLALSDMGEQFLSWLVEQN